MPVLTIVGMDTPVNRENNESVEAHKMLVSDYLLTMQLSMCGGFEQSCPMLVRNLISTS